MNLLNDTRECLKREIQHGVLMLSLQFRALDFLRILASLSDTQAALLIRHAHHLHLLQRILSAHSELSIAALGFVDELLQLVSERHPVCFSIESGG